MTRKRFSREDLVESMKGLAKLLGRTPRARDADAHPDVLTAKTYINRFGSWLEALEAADLRPDSRQTGYDRETLLSHLQDLAESLGRTPTKADLYAANGASPPTYESHFGSWPQAIREAGLEPGGRFKRYDRAELLDILRELAGELGHTPSTAELSEREDLPSAGTYRYRFGRWNAALREAGLPPLQINRGPGDAREGQEGISGEVTTPAGNLEVPQPTYGKGRRPLCSIEEDYSGRRVTAFQFEGHTRRAASWTGAAAELFSLLCDGHRQDFEETAVTIVGQKRRYFVHDFRKLRKPAQIRGTNLFFETNLPANMLVKLCYTVIERMGFDRSALSFETEG
jgi:hypothetical protein